MTKVVLLYRTDLPGGVKTRPWHVRPNRLPKPLENLQLLLLTEQKFASGQTLKLKDEFGFVIPKLLRDLPSHPIEPRDDLLLISTREPDARALLDLCLYDNGAVGHPHRGHASNNVLLIFHVVRGFGSECKRYGVTHPVTIFSEGTLW